MMYSDPLERRKAEIEDAMLDKAESGSWIVRFPNSPMVYAVRPTREEAQAVADALRANPDEWPLDLHQDARPPQPIPTPEPQPERLPGVEGEAKAHGICESCGIKDALTVHNYPAVELLRIAGWKHGRPCNCCPACTKDCEGLV